MRLHRSHVIAAAIGCVFASHALAQQVAADIDRLIKLQDKGVFGILEGTQSEYVSAGSDNRILRWPWTSNRFAPTFPKSQQWHFAKGADGRYTLKNIEYGNAMTMSANGWFWRGDTDIASFKLSYDGSCNLILQEKTRDEYLTLGGDNRYVRWGWKGDKSQLFGLRFFNPWGDTRAIKPNYYTSRLESFPGVVARHVAVSGLNVYVIEGNGSGDGRILKWNGDDGFLALPGGGVRVAVEGSGAPWVINASGAIFRLDSGGWRLIDGKATDIAAYGQEVLVVGLQGTVWRWSGSAWAALPLFDEKGVAFKASRVAVQDGGIWVALAEDGQSVYTRTTQATAWTALPKPPATLREIAGGKELYAIGTNGAAYRYQFDKRYTGGKGAPTLPPGWKSSNEVYGYGYGAGPYLAVASNPSGNPVLIHTTGAIQYFAQDFRVYDPDGKKSDPYRGEFVSEFPRRCFPLR
jgi:hypothetical protein